MAAPFSILEVELCGKKTNPWRDFERLIALDFPTQSKHPSFNH
jgi:hypothetical protein